MGTSDEPSRAGATAATAHADATAEAGSSQEALLAAAANRRPPSLLRELCEFAWHNKKWWIIPLVGLLLLLALLVAFGDAGLLPFIYALF